MNTEPNPYETEWIARQNSLPGEAIPWMRRLRQEAMERYRASGFPTTRLEDWKYTSLKPILQKGFHFPEPSCIGLDPSDLDALLIDRRDMPRLVFVNGTLSRPLSNWQQLPQGVEIASLATRLAEYPEQVEPCLRARPTTPDHGFAELNRALWRDGAFVCFRQETRMPIPVQLLFLSLPSSVPVITQPHTVILVEAGAEGQIIESYATLGDCDHFTNGLTTIFLQHGARLNHLLVQNESHAAYHLATMRVQQESASRFVSQAFSFGGRLTRQDIHLQLGGEEAECDLDGLFVATGRQHTDFHTWIRHDASHTTSRQHYKGILDGHGRGVFNGAVLVPQSVRETQSAQVNNNLLLTNTAEIDTKPQLEIFSNAVQCTHGATVGNLDPVALFYLRSRGVDQEEARRLLIKAFAGEILDRIQPQSVRAWLENRLAF
ncbi:MAG: Fe-S cluster assembly protein SufD [Magnetococcales bacterium]|nr:Fe-S cluster assembly protein SufD [Magnetococcales bacterium]MBF0438548.1 Fe-S cluster assembly protein SufD [Magnetococcales bacterium]